MYKYSLDNQSSFFVFPNSLFFNLVDKLVHNAKTARLTWSLPPHSPMSLNFGIIGLTSKLRHDHHPLKDDLRGFFCPQLA